MFDSKMNEAKQAHNVDEGCIRISCVDYNYISLGAHVAWSTWSLKEAASPVSKSSSELIMNPPRT